MGNRLRVNLAVLEALLFLLAVWFEPTCIVRGTLRGEAWYGGHPTSWWRREFGHWDVEYQYNRMVDDKGTPLGLFKMRAFTRPKSRFEEFRDRWLWKPEPVVDDRWIMNGPPNIAYYARDEDDRHARAVLQELVDDDSSTVRWIARFGLGLIEYEELVPD